MNKVQLRVFGNLGRAPEQKQTKGGTNYVNFSLCANERLRQKDPDTGKPREEKHWFEVNVWGAQGESCLTYLKKGSKIYVEGREKIEAYVRSKTDGEAGFTRIINTNEVMFLDGGNGNGSKPASAAAPAQAPGPDATDDDIPF